MKPTIKTVTYPNGQKRYEIPHINNQRHGLATWWHINGQKKYEVPYVNGKKHGLETWWHKNGQKSHEIPYTNGQAHGLMIWCRSNGYLRFIEKRHQGQLTWEISFPLKEHISEDVEVELFFYKNPEVI